jgi:hypothetical protein
MKYLPVRIPPGKGNISLKDAIDAARAVSLNGTHVRKEAKARGKRSSGSSGSTAVSQRVPKRSK